MSENEITPGIYRVYHEQVFSHTGEMVGEHFYLQSMQRQGWFTHGSAFDDETALNSFLREEKLNPDSFSRTYQRIDLPDPEAEQKLTDEQRMENNHAQQLSEMQQRHNAERKELLNNQRCEREKLNGTVKPN